MGNSTHCSLCKCSLISLSRCMHQRGKESLHNYTNTCTYMNKTTIINRRINNTTVLPMPMVIPMMLFTLGSDGVFKGVLSMYNNHNKN